MTISLYSIEHAPANVPLWQQLMADLASPPADRVARTLGLSVRTIRRYNATGYAPRCACLAVFWMTSWGRHAVNAQASNDAALAVGYVNSLRTEVDALRAAVKHLQSIGEFGSANEPGQRLTTRRPGRPGVR
jgi:hypothetical protein